MLEAGSANHLAKVRKDKPGFAVNLEKELRQIMDLMTPGDGPFPSTLPAEDQALFGLGYHHQTGACFARADAASSEPESVK